MSLIPNPLHPAVVHFPIVLLLLGTVVAASATVWRKHHLPGLAAILLVLGALGTWVAVESGESDGGLIEHASPQTDSLVDAHETWAKRTLSVSVVAALAATGSALAGRKPRIARFVAIIAGLAALGAAYCVYETGHRGGALVFRHGAGVELASTPGPAPVAPTKNPTDRDAD